jgi:hypothetical protein
VKVIESCTGGTYWYGIFAGRKKLMENIMKRGISIWMRKSAAIRNAKAMAKRIGIPYDPEIIK